MLVNRERRTAGCTAHCRAGRGVQGLEGASTCLFTCNMRSQRLGRRPSGCKLCCLAHGHPMLTDLTLRCAHHPFMQVPLPDIEVLDHAQLQDGHLWEPSIIAGIVFDSMLRKGISQAGLPPDCF